ncbi:protein NRT1/ PTR FAMILY 2.11-like [Asparagus officinalis]|uniref:protein NRT1/ PTR FAMILY 2.11-like n=1 Tax=Asparagus officinalis TaxID=4686 RepID=UPI00098E0662|nr:protein NRT1/ PTR FAMILY 2.11-like [Asparagus officinalis]
MTEKTEAEKTQIMKEEVEEPSIKYRGWKAMPYVIGNETFEKLGTLGTSSNLLVYLTTVFHMQSVTATTLLQVFNGTTNLAPVFGAFLSDTFFGRYWTLGVASVSSLLGMLILTLTAAISSLHPPQCHNGQHCLTPTRTQLAVILSSFLFLIIGAGGIRPCNLAFGADQFDPKTDSGRKGIASFFNWYYFTFTFAMMISATVIIYVQTDVSWTLGLAIPTVLMFFSCAVFFVGTRIYVRVKPEGSPFTSIAQVFVAAIRKRRLAYPDDPRGSLFNPPCKNSLNSKLPKTDQFRFIEKAAILATTDELNPDGSATNPWLLCTLQQVEEVKCLLRIMPIWSAGILYSVATFTNSSYVVFSALQSNRHIFNTSFEIPAGSFTVFSMLALSIWIPIYDQIIVPKLQRVTKKGGGITLLQRIGVGILMSIIGMIVAALVEQRRRSFANSRISGDISSMSSLWLVPQLTIIGISEGFSMIGQVEFYYKQFPENMRSGAGSLVFLGGAAGNYLSGLIITVIHRATGGDGKRNWLDEDLNKGRLDYFYFLIAVIGGMNFMYFIACARWYRYKNSDTEMEISLEEKKTNDALV